MFRVGRPRALHSGSIESTAVPDGAPASRQDVGGGPYRSIDPKRAFDHYVCPRCRCPVVVPAGEAPRSMVCARDKWPLVTLAAFEKCDGDPLLGMELPGGFTPVEVIGAGSTSAVYRATVAPPSSRRGTALEPPSSAPRLDAAVKVMRLDGADHADALDAWEREVSALEKLRSPHLVRMLDSGRITHPASFFVALEWLEGPTLDAIDAPTIPEAIDLGIDLAVGLAALHTRGFVHGDVKPRNAVRGPRGATVFDLGSSFVEGARQPGFGEAFFRASPAYAAPERIVGGRVSRAADTYSLGATLFRLVTGRPLFEGPAELVAEAHLGSRTPRARDVTARHRGAASDELWAGLDALFVALLAKDPAARPPEPASLLKAFRNRSMKVYGEEPNV